MAATNNNGHQQQTPQTTATTTTGDARGVPVRPSQTVQQQQNQQAGLLKSSLDIVWSYSRSQAFFGSNLPSSPSFVQRYRRPSSRYNPSDDEEGGHSRSSSAASGPGSRRRRRGRGGDTSEVTGTSEDDVVSSMEEEEEEVEEDEGEQDGHLGLPLPNDGDLRYRYRGHGYDQDREEDGDDYDDYSEGDEDGDEDLYSDEEGEERSGLHTDRTGSASKTPRGVNNDEPLPANAVVEQGDGANRGGDPEGDGRPKRRRRRRTRTRLLDEPSRQGVSKHRASFNSLGLSDEPDYHSAVHNGRRRTLLPRNVASSTAAAAAAAEGDDTRPRTQSSVNNVASGPFAATERTPLLEKLTRTDNSNTGHSTYDDATDQLPAPSEDDRIYSSSPPEAFPFPRRSPHLKKRRLSERRPRSFVHEGSSTSGQTLFNAINVLVGIGILAQPLAFSQAGWVLGCTLLFFCSLLTNYTAKILAKALAEDPTLMTYADVGAKAFGAPARNFINVLFCLEISALCVALIVLLGDSLHTLLLGSITTWKIVGFAVMFPTLFLPLRYLSIASLIGILSIITLTVTVLVDGCVSHARPGSLHNPMPTNVGPNWSELPIAFGLIMSGFGGHAVFPSLARDMKKPQDFNRVCNLAFVVATAVYLFMGVVGYLMFGDQVSDEITRDLLHTPTLPRKLNLIAVSMVAVTPICKYAISSTPLESTISYLLGVDQNTRRPRRRSSSAFKDSSFSNGNGRRFSGSGVSNASRRSSTVQRSLGPAGAGGGGGGPSASAISSIMSAIHQPLADVPPRSKAWIRQIVKLVTALVLLAIAIFIPSFDRVMGLLGAFSVFVICAIGPIAANLALHRSRMSKLHIAVDLILLLVSAVMAAVGTIWVFLPKSR